MGMGEWEPCTCQPDRPNCPACTGAEHPCLLCKQEPPRPRDGWWFISVGAGPASYARRAELKALHLRWDPAAREWSGIVLGSDIGALEGLGLAVEVWQRLPDASLRGGGPRDSDSLAAGPPEGRRSPPVLQPRRHRVLAGHGGHGPPGPRGGRAGPPPAAREEPGPLGGSKSVNLPRCTGPCGPHDRQLRQAPTRNQTLSAHGELEAGGTFLRRVNATRTMTTTAMAATPTMRTTTPSRKAGFPQPDPVHDKEEHTHGPFQPL